jgi:hypothetical protein
MRLLILTLYCGLAGGLVAGAADANRLAYLDEFNPFHPGLHFPRLATPQWVGEPGVEAVVILGIDDLRGNVERYEEFLRPILERLKQEDGRAAVSIFSNAVEPDHPRFPGWIEEGISLEVHTLHHPCPILAQGNFEAAWNTFHGWGHFGGHFGVRSRYLTFSRAGPHPDTGWKQLSNFQSRSGTWLESVVSVQRDEDGLM